MRPTLLLLAGLTALPLLAAAQASPKFYVEAGASILTDRVFRSYSYSNDPVMVGPSLTFGAWLSPRLAVQIGGAIAWRHENDSYSYYDNGSPKSYLVTSTTDNRQRLYTLPVLLRYAFTPNAARFHVDGLAGVTVLHSNGSYSRISTNNASIPSDYYYESYAYDYHNTQVNLTLGPALRYALTSNLEVTADPLVNMSLDTQSYANFRDRLFWNFLVGAHYSFGQR